MQIKSKYYDSPKQDEIMEFLFKVRGADVTQITRALYKIISINEVSAGNIKLSYGLLKKLERYGLVNYCMFKGDYKARPKKVYYLSKKGYEQFKEEFKRQGENGLFSNNGDLKYSLYKPPTKNLYHHLMTVDVMVDVYILSKKENSIDFANNLYAAEKAVKPDFVITFLNQKYFVEIDRMHERGQALKEKFEHYNNYFSELKNKNLPLPWKILFIVPRDNSEKMSAHRKIRMNNVMNAFVISCSEYVEEVDLCFLSIDNFIVTLVNILLSKGDKTVGNYLKQSRRYDVNDILYQSEILLNEMKPDKINEVVIAQEYYNTISWVRLCKKLNDFNIKYMAHRRKDKQTLMDPRERLGIPNITIIGALKDEIVPFNLDFLSPKYSYIDIKQLTQKITR